MSAGQAKASSDTLEGCRIHAEQDRARADAMDTDNGRLRLRRSADAWDSRAHEPEGFAETQDARRADAIAEWNDAEEDSEGDDKADEEKGP